MTAYTFTPIGPDGPAHAEARTVYGHDLERVRLLLAQLDAAAKEIAGLKEQLRLAEDRLRLAYASEHGAIKAMRFASNRAERADLQVRRLDLLWHGALDLLARDRRRLDDVARALAHIAHRCPEARQLVDQWREEIWRPR